MNPKSWIMQTTNGYFIHRLDLPDETVYTVMSKKEIETEDQSIASYATLKAFDNLPEAEKYVQTLYT